MKLNNCIACVLLSVAFAVVGCQPENPPIGPGGGGGGDTIPTPKPDTTKVDTAGWNIPAKALTIKQAREICAALASEEVTSEKYYVKGFIKKLHSKNADGISSFGNASFYMVDATTDTDDFLAFQVLGLNGKKVPSQESIAVGDYVVIYGQLTNYNGTYETVNKGAAYIWKSTNPKLSDGGGGGDPGVLTGDGSEENPFTAADVILMNNTQSGTYFVKAYIVGQVAGKALSSGSEFTAPFSPSSTTESYGTNLLLASKADETSPSKCVPVQLPKGAIRNGLNLPENPMMHGKEVIIYGSLEAYFSAAGIKSPSYAKVGDVEFGTKPKAPTGDEILNESLLTQQSFDKFTIVDILGDLTWTYSTKGYGAVMTGFSGGKNSPNEDWFITPVMDLSGKTSVKVSFEHSFGPAASVPAAKDAPKQYMLLVSNDFTDDVAKATWTTLDIPTYCTSAWAYVNSGDITIPSDNLKANCRIAWKYVCENISATWEIRNIVVR